MIRGDIETYSSRLYEKCQHCPLFVEVNEAWHGQPGVARFAHSSRGDAADERIESTHDAEPSGLLATLPTWMVYGPSEMRERFVTIPQEV